MEGLGRVFDLSIGYLNIDLNTAGATGKRVKMRDTQSLTIVALLPATAGVEDVILDVQQHTASSGGSSADLDAAALATASVGIDHYYIKAAALLLGTETWTKVTQTVTGSEVTVAGATYGASQCIVAIEVNGTMLADGYSYVSVITPDVGSTARVCTVLYILHDLAVQRKPTNLAAALS